ncbi:MAG: hypothetical protein ACR2G0_06435, partial [Chthoniobacterales bacterium]
MSAIFRLASKRAAWALVSLWAWSGCAGTRVASPDFTVSQRQFSSGGARILVDVYTPVANGVHPPVLVLHGAGGMLFDGP